MIKPKQARSIETWNRLLDATGELLAEVGVERISTNIVAERAGVTPPTLYRYFTSKYALLRTLGERLMEAQNAITSLDPLQDDDAVVAFLLEHVVLTRSTPGGPWIMVMLRAVPMLTDVRLNSHRKVASELTQKVLALQPHRDPEETAQICRFCIDVGYAAVELALEEPELDATIIMRSAAKAMRHILGLDGRQISG